MGTIRVEVLHGRPILRYIAQMHSYSGAWEMCPCVLWGVTVNGKVQNPLGWRRITSHRVLWGERHRCCIDPADKHRMAGSLSKCQVSQTEMPRQPGMKFGAVHRRFADKPAKYKITCALTISHIIFTLKFNWRRIDVDEEQTCKYSEVTCSSTILTIFFFIQNYKMWNKHQCIRHYWAFSYVTVPFFFFFCLK